MNTGIAPIEYSRAALPWTYLIYFLIRKLSYIYVCSPSSKPSRIVLLLDVMYATDPHHRSKSYSPPRAAHLFLHVHMYEASLYT